MPYQLLQYKPGIVKDITEYSAGKNGPFWVDSNLIRFRNGYPTKIGGWKKNTLYRTDSAGTITSTETTIQGVARRMVFWRATSDGEDRIAVGTHNHLYIIQDDVTYDITPLRDTSATATTTSEALDNSETEIDLTSVTGFTTSGAVIIDSEIITYTGISSLTLTGCTRGTNSTSAATHDNGATATQALIGPIATTNESTTLTITDTAHGAKQGDFVVFSGATATGGVAAEDLNRKAGYEITAVATNTFTVTAPNAATSTVSAGGGNAVVIKYLIGIDAKLGTQSSAPALGWGVGGWGNEEWGNARSVSESDVSLDNSSWSLSLWGEDLIATVRGGAIYWWDTSGGIGNRASLVSAESSATSIPAIARVTTVSFPDRHFIAGGCSQYGGGGNLDEMLVRWSNQEDFTAFAPTATNTAGDQRLEIGTKIVAIVSSREETLISTDEAIYGMTFVGPPFTFSFRLLSSNSGAAGINTMINIDGDVYWMGKRNFYRYDGGIAELPCPVQQYVFNRMQTRYIDKVVVGHNKRFKEITWWYVSNDVEFTITVSSFSWFYFLKAYWFFGQTVSVGDVLLIRNGAQVPWCGTGSDFEPVTYSRVRVTKVDPDNANKFTVLLECADPTFPGQVVDFVAPPTTWADVLREDYVNGQSVSSLLGTITSVENGVNASDDGFSSHPEPDSYVTYNYQENVWTIGTLPRTVWLDSYGAREVPFAFDSDGYLYNHETGTSADGGVMTAWVEGAPQEISSTGDNTYMVDKIIPDATMSEGTSLSAFVNTKKYPVSITAPAKMVKSAANQGLTKGPYTITPTISKISVRAKGRQMSLKVQSSGINDDWTMGTFRVNAREDGMR